MTQAFAAPPADQIYKLGPETLVAQSSTIVAGPVAGLERRVLATSQPAGPDAVDLRWTLSGRVEPATVLKGSVAGPATFTRLEQSPLLPGGPGGPDWQRPYGDWQSGDRIVLFLGEGLPPAGVAVPSGTGERDLALLVRDLAAILARPSHQWQAAWLSYLDAAPQEQGRKAALRALLQLGAPWAVLAPPLTRLLSDPAHDERFAMFAYGFAVHGLVNGLWAPDQASVAAFLGDRFESETRPQLLLSYLLSLKLALRYANEEATRTERLPIRRRLLESLKRREAALQADPQLAGQYRELRATYRDQF